MVRYCTTVTCDDYEIETVATNERDVVDKWIRQVYGRYSSFGYRKIIVGLDIEWKPYEMPQMPRTIQLCTGKKCLIVQLPLRNCKCHETLLAQFVRNKRFVFAGVAVKSDIKKIEEFSQLCFHDWGLDLAAEARRMNIDCKGRYGLESLALNIGQLNFRKDRRMARSNWANVELDEDQIEYATRDAFVSFHIAKMLRFNYS